jgi:pyruvate dehydrogenase E1 component beta subunit
MAQITLVEAINLALKREMEIDPDVVVLGQDVGVDGGVFRATLGLAGRFGAGRVIDTPLAEGLIAGMSIGMAVEGLKPVAEIQFSGFAYTTIDQILNHAGRMRSRTRGRLSCPMVMRTRLTGRASMRRSTLRGPETMFSHIPGIRVVYPLPPPPRLRPAAGRDPRPGSRRVLEPTRLYRLIKEEVADDGQAAPLDQCYTAREGTDITLVAWGAMVRSPRRRNRSRGARDSGRSGSTSPR